MLNALRSFNIWHSTFKIHYVNAFAQDFKLGVLGGGQLGRMMIQSAIDFNLDIHVLDPDANAPCKHLATDFVVGDLLDYDTVYRWGKDKSLITIEIEKVNTEALEALQQEGVTVYPQPEVIRLIQDKREQKQFYLREGIPTADFILTENAAEVAQHANRLPAVNKLGRGGYDGRGVQLLRSAGDLKDAFDAPGLLEDLVDFETEISVVVARNARGEIRTFPVVEMVFHPTANLVEFLFSPARISVEVANEAERIACDVIEKLDLVGLLAVEMFVTKDGKVLVNEVAPRTHNSGHQTIEGNDTSQFEQHIRAILNWPLGSTAGDALSAMVNVLGEAGFSGPALYEGMDEVLAVDGVHVHLYGKKLTKPFRKMGHVTITDSTYEGLTKKARFVKDTLKVKA
ncbi:MAG TPA: 5-(carboxyamino)imidazole ribonucleotide synthase [Cytophagales bacterium]|nr:5-(carboxyamino)imidazole ribonucleotide synthase [Cytophagales bacterium]HAP64477.1 5-(carboxyamino)imidazole ribonucleotide synthase [Cytophagales bacterium]